MAPQHAGRSTRRRKIGATIAVVAVIGVAGGYGTYSAWTDTTELNGAATAGTIQLNEAGADSRTFAVSGLLPGDTASVCFVVASPGSAGPVPVTLEATPTVPTGAPNTSFAGSATVALERVTDTTSDAFLTINDGNANSTALTRTTNCNLATVSGVAAAPVPVGSQTIATLSSLTETGLTIAAGTRVVYRVAISLPASAPTAAQGGTASFRLHWTGSVGS